MLIVGEVDGRGPPLRVARPRETTKVSIFPHLCSHFFSDMSGMKGETPTVLKEGPQDAKPLCGTLVEGTVLFHEKHFLDA
jgi:hypothetical protein